MPTNVSHPDEVIDPLKRRWGQGAANIDQATSSSTATKPSRCALAKGAEAMPGWITRHHESFRPARTRRSRLPHRPEVVLRPQGQSEKPKYVLVNGDESEPGTCKDHVIFLEDPHSVIEGTMIAGLAIGSEN